MDKSVLHDSVSRRQFAAALLAPLALAKTADLKSLVFCCSGSNDVYRVLTSAGGRMARYDTPAKAIARAPKAAGILILPDGYPETPVQFSDQLLSQARDKKLRVYIEYSSSSATSVEKPQSAEWERAVVASSFFGPSLAPERILSLHECRYLPLPAARGGATMHLALARVAGFDTAVFGLPEKDVHPLLVEDESGCVLKAATQLSRFITARYEPTAAWTSVWQAVLKWLLASAEEIEFKWTPGVRPSWVPSATLPENAERH